MNLNGHRPDQIAFSAWLVIACLVLAYVIMFWIGISLLLRDATIPGYKTPGTPEAGVATQKERLLDTGQLTPVAFFRSGGDRVLGRATAELLASSVPTVLSK